MHQSEINNIIDKYSDMVYRIALMQMKNTYDAEDVFQDVFVKLVRYIDTIENEAHLKAWLIRTTVNYSKSSLTSAFKRLTRGFQEEDANKLKYEDKYNEGSLLDTLQQLPTKYRTVLYLFYYEDMSVKQISEIVGQKETTVKSQLSRGRDMLKEFVKREDYI